MHAIGLRAFVLGYVKHFSDQIEIEIHCWSGSTSRQNSPGPPILTSAICTYI